MWPLSNNSDDLFPEGAHKNYPGETNKQQQYTVKNSYIQEWSSL